MKCILFSYFYYFNYIEIFEYFAVVIEKRNPWMGNLHDFWCTQILEELEFHSTIGKNHFKSQLKILPVTENIWKKYLNA
jgi:hypothetical protein